MTLIDSLRNLEESLQYTKPQARPESTQRLLDLCREIPNPWPPKPQPSPKKAKTLLGALGWGAWNSFAAFGQPFGCFSALDGLFWCGKPMAALRASIPEQGSDSEEAGRLNKRGLTEKGSWEVVAGVINMRYLYLWLLRI